MKANVYKISIIIISILLSILSYKYLPESMASHWNMQGLADAYSPKLNNLVAFPSLIIVMSLALSYFPKIDPKYESIKEFLPEYSKFSNMLLGFFLVLQTQVILWNLGYQVSMAIIMPIMLGVLFYFVGDMIGNSKMNYTIGIRTPWTLSNETNWNKTHKLGSKLFKLALPIFLLGTLSTEFTFILVIGYLLVITIGLFIYSYLEFKRGNKK